MFITQKRMKRPNHAQKNSFIYINQKKVPLIFCYSTKNRSRLPAILPQRVAKQQAFVEQQAMLRSNEPAHRSRAKENSAFTFEPDK